MFLQLATPLLPLTTLQRKILQHAAEKEPLQPAALTDLVAPNRKWAATRRKKAEVQIERLTRIGYLCHFREGDLTITEKGLARLDPRSARNMVIHFLAWLITSAIGGMIAEIASDWIRSG